MEPRKLTKEDIDKVRHIEGFPIGEDEDIIALSDPPYYTACPNPFIGEFIEKYGTPYDEETDDYHCEPFAADVSEGKNDPIYNAHSYHTKVPHKAIMRYILHYTKPGDIVFDGFCGTGMTGVAAQMCGNPDPEFKLKIESEMPNVNWGERKAILSDLSPAATFIAYNYNTPVDVAAFQKEAERILEEVEKECGWMYETQHIEDGIVKMDITGKPILGRINYTVWSDVFICPTCSREMVFWEVAVDKKTGKVHGVFNCPHCDSELKKRDCGRAQETHFDNKLGKTITMAKQIPVLINYSVGKKRYEKTPDEYDLELIKRINSIDIAHWCPINELPDGDKTIEPIRLGITHVHQFYLRRNLLALVMFWECVLNSKNSHETKCALYALATGVMLGVSKLQRFRLFSTFPNMILSGTLYIGSTIREWNTIDWIAGKHTSFRRMKGKIKDFKRDTIITTSSAASLLGIKTKTIDYIFTDPPFGANLNYSELSFLWESWLKVITNQKTEAIMSRKQGKGLPEYQELMVQCFSEYYRVLKPGRWMTVVFHNSKNTVWNAIQEALQRVGFIIADVRIIDKQQGSFNQVNAAFAVKQDLVISAYKPKEYFRHEFALNAGSEEAAWAFVRQHLGQLPTAVVKDGYIEIISERQDFLLYDRMVAYHVMQGMPVPLDATDFYRGLEEKFLKRDGMYFLPDQVNEYDTARIKHEVEEIQFDFLVTNEKTAITWLYQKLVDPQTYADIQPKFMQEVKSVDKFEAMPELAVLLEENFIQDEKGRWYIPDRTKEGDMAKLREKKLWKEFEEYMNSKGRLRLFRIEAIRLGFSMLWKNRNYQAIVDIAERLPAQTVQEDANLLMYYDISLSRI